MAKNPNRVRIVMMSYQDHSTESPTSYSGTGAMFTGLPRMIRRRELKLIVPLADSTIFEMERRGEFPRRFNLTPRCVVWDLEEVEAWLAERRQSSLEGRANVAPAPKFHQRKTAIVKPKK